MVRMKTPHSSDQYKSRSYEKPAIRPEMTVRQVATDYPPCRDIFVEYGEPTDRPVRFGHFQTLTLFARFHGVDLDQLLDRLSKAAGDRDPRIPRRGRCPLARSWRQATLAS